MTKGSTNKILCDIYGLKTNNKELLVLTSKKFICFFMCWPCLTVLNLAFKNECSCSVPLTLTGSKSRVCWDHSDLIYKWGIPSWLGLSQDTDTSKKTMVTLKCGYVLQCYMGTTLSHDKLHAYQHPHPRNGDKSSEDSGVMEKKTEEKKKQSCTQSSHSMDCTCQCTIAYTGWPPGCSAWEYYNNNKLRRNDAEPVNKYSVSPPRTKK